MVIQFYLKKTINGNLIGECSTEFRIISFSATILKINNILDFQGQYFASWLDNSNSNNVISGILNIEPVHVPPVNNQNTYTLTWGMQNNINIKYTGNGFLLDQTTLVGFFDRPNK